MVSTSQKLSVALLLLVLLLVPLLYALFGSGGSVH